LASARLAPLWREFNAKHYAAVVDAARALLERHESGEVHYLLAQSLHSLERNPNEALLHYDRALDLGFDEFWVRIHRARLRQSLGEDPGADADLDRAAAINPSDPNAARTLASARVASLWRQFNEKDYAAVVEGARALASRHESGDVHYLLAQSLHSLEQEPHEGLRHYDRALELGFDEFWVRFHRGRLLQALGENSSAETDLARAAAIKPDDPDAKQMLISARMEPLWREFKRQEHSAVVRRGRALLECEELGEAHYVVALSLDQLGEASDALSHLTRALELGFDEFWVRFHRGRLLHARGDSAAHADLARVAALKPDDPVTKDLLRSTGFAPAS
jgi:tetratricopeptide (TPR) repeat protein